MIVDTTITATVDGVEETVFEDEAFRGLYVAGSSYETHNGIRDYTIARTGGWPVDGVTLIVTTEDDAGNVVTRSIEWLLPADAAFEVADEDDHPLIAATLARIPQQLRG